MPPKWGYRLVAFVPSLAFAVVSPLVLPSFPLVPLVNGGMVLSHLLASVAFPFCLSSALLLDLLVLLSLLDLSPLHTTLSSPIRYLIPAYSGLILHLWILILRSTHHSQQGVASPSRESPSWSLYAVSLS